MLNLTAQYRRAPFNILQTAITNQPGKRLPHRAFSAVGEWSEPLLDT
jgi:hypothetical protein